MRVRMQCDLWLLISDAFDLTYNNHRPAERLNLNFKLCFALAREQPFFDFYGWLSNCSRLYFSVMVIPSLFNKFLNGETN
jgi:hypothetical protein